MKFHFACVLVCILLAASIPAHANQWDYHTTKDEMTGKKKSFATSPEASPTKRMGFPYGDVIGWIGFGCDGESEWVYVGFSESPNLTNVKPQSGGYSTFSTRIRWDDTIDNISMSQEWGSKFLHFEFDSVVIEKIMKAGNVLLELSWYSSGRVYFNFSLNGSSKAIQSARAACG